MKKMIYFLGVYLFIVGMEAFGQGNKTNQVQIESRIVEVNKFYLKGDLGFAFGLDPVILNQTTTITGETTTSSTTDAVKARLGSGIPAEIAAGFKFNKNFSVELGIDYNHGLSTTTNNLLNGDNTKTVIHATTLSITPSVVAQIKTGEVIPYARIGLDIGVVNHFYTVTTGLVSSFKATSSGEKRTLDYGGLAIGIKAAAGVEVPLGKVVSLFGEIQARAFSFSPKHGKVTKYSIDGVDQMPILTTKQKKWDYVKTVNYPDQIGTDQPNQFLKVVHPVSNAALVVGVKVNFGK